MKTSPFKVFFLFIIFTTLGFFVVPWLSVKLNPSNSLPSVKVTFSWPSAPSYVLERDVTSLLESGFSTIKGVEKLHSKSSNGIGEITIKFDKYTDIDIARFEIAATIRQLYAKLPERVSYPTIIVNRPDSEEQQAFVSYSINAEIEPYKIQEIVKAQIEPVIGAIKTVDRVGVYGANPIEYIVVYDTSVLKTLKLAKSDLVQTLRTVFDRKSLGEISFDKDYITLSIYPNGDYLNWHFPIKKIDDKLIYFDEITTVKKQEIEAESYYRINGNNAVFLSVYATKDANVLRLVKKVEKKLEELKPDLPAGYTIIKSYDSTSFLNFELDKIYKRSLYTVVILLLFILIVSRSIKYLLLIVISLIANISIAFLSYYILNIEIQLYSLAGITISLGLIIDNIIVMIDHIKHQGNRKIFIPILASTLTTAGALTIIYFLDDEYKVNLIDFALVIVVNLSISLIIALFLVPALLQRVKIVPRKESALVQKFKKWFYHLYHKVITFQLRFKALNIIIIILVFGLPLFLLPKNIDSDSSWYAKTYNSTIGSEWYKDDIRPSLDKYLGGSFRLFSKYVLDNSSYRKNQETRLFVRASMEKGTTVKHINKVFVELENYLSEYEEIKQYNTTVSSGDLAFLEIVFEDKYRESSFPNILKAKLITKVLDFGGIKWSVYGVGNGFNNRGGITGEPVNFSVKAKGYNYDELNAWADTLRGNLLKHPRIHKVFIRENNYQWDKAASYEYKFNLNKELLGKINIPPAKIINELKELTVSKSEDVSLNIFERYTPIRLESNDAHNYDIWSIKNMPLDSLHTPVVLKEVAYILKELEDENIFKENQEYIRLVQFQYVGSAKFGSEFLNEKLEELQSRLPLGYRFERTNGGQLSNETMNRQHLVLLFIVLSIIYLICSVLFESLKQPFIILSVIPISFIGVFLTFYLFDFNFDQGGLVSFVLLSGITVNASIFIINGFNRLKKEHPNSVNTLLYLEAFKQKIFPILLTIISTILGFIPFVIDGHNEVFWFALGAGTIGGLLFSLLGILIYLPIFTLQTPKR